MKKFFFSVMILALAATACQKESASEQTICGEGPVFIATIADDCCTRTTLKGMTPVWNVGDEASINGYIYCAIPLADNTRKATFVAKYPKSGFPFAPYVAWYPASIYDATTKTTTLPSVQKHGDFSINPMVAVSGSPKLSFKNVCAVLSIRVDSGDIDLVKSIRVSSANCATSGEFTLEKTAEGYKAVLKDPEDVKQTVVLDCGEGVKPSDDGTLFYIAIPAQIYKSLKIELSGDGSTYTRAMVTNGDKEINVNENEINELDFNHKDWYDLGTGQIYDKCFFDDHSSYGIQNVQILKSTLEERYRVVEPYANQERLAATWGEKSLGGQACPYIEFYECQYEGETFLRWDNYWYSTMLFQGVAGYDIRAYYPSVLSDEKAEYDLYSKWTDTEVASLYPYWYIYDVGGLGCYPVVISLPGGPDLNEWLDDQGLL